jgi:hypothetical protein
MYWFMLPMLTRNFTPPAATGSSDSGCLVRDKAATVLVDELDQTAQTRCAAMRHSRKATSLDLRIP